jgi:hypothetical protein
VDADQAREIKKFTQTDKVSGYHLTRKDLSPTGTYDEVYVLRLWRTHPIIQYEGVVHEALRHKVFEEAWPGKVLLTSDVFFWHDGYVQDISGKAQRNADLLRHELALHPDNVAAQAMLATTLTGTKDPEGAGRLTKLVDELLAERPISPPTQVALALAMYIELVMKGEIPGDRVEEVVKMALAWFPKVPVLIYYAGVLARKREDLQEALSHFLILEALINSGEYDRSIATPSELLNETLWKSMGFVATKLGRQDVVQRCQRRLAMHKRP